MERWIGKTAVVTGASAGIGAAICVSLANAGMRVVGLARRAPLIDELQSRVTGTGSIVSRQCDVSEPDEVAATFKWVDDKLGGTDVLVNNAGVFFGGTMTDVGPQQVKEEDILKTIDINVKGLVLCTRHGIASMRKRGIDGHVININSIAGHYIPFEPMFNVYPGTKHAVTGVTASLDNELADFGSKIKATSISPGLVATDLVGSNSEGPLTAPALRPEDVADAVLYVVSTPPSVNFTDNTFKNYYYPEPETNDDEVSDDDEATVGYKLKQVIARKRAGNSIDRFFERPIKKAKSVKKSSSVSRSTDDGVSYISSGQDDGVYSSHLIKIEIYDVQKIKSIAPADHWKHADVRLKFYTSSEEDKQLESTRDVIFNITKQLAEKDTCVKYFINNKKL